MKLVSVADREAAMGQLLTRCCSFAKIPASWNQSGARLGAYWGCEPLPISATPMGARSSEIMSCCTLVRSIFAWFHSAARVVRSLSCIQQIDHHCRPMTLVRNDFNNIAIMNHVYSTTMMSTTTHLEPQSRLWSVILETEYEGPVIDRNPAEPHDSSPTVSRYTKCTN